MNILLQQMIHRRQKHERIERKRQQKQQIRHRLIEHRRQKQIRITKKQIVAKAKTKTFACKRCSIKYFNNIQFHKHVDEHHIKKIKNIKFEIFTSTSIFAPTLFDIQNHKTSISSSKKSLTISISTIILNQTSIAFPKSISITFLITSVTSSQIT